MLNKIMINAEMPTMNTEQLRELQDRVFLAINEAFKKQDAADLRYLQELELQIADRIDYLEFQYNCTISRRYDGQYYIAHKEI